MIKFFWYTYFAIYMIFQGIARFKVTYLRKRDNDAADIFAYKRVQSMCKYILKISKTSVEIKGIENIPKEACLFISNHQAIFDAFVLIAQIDSITGFIAKKEISKIPLVGGWLKEIHTIYIDRGNIREGIKAIGEGVEKLQMGYNMIIFPEGTRSLSSEMGEFKKGSMKLATKAGVPIVPVTLDGTYRVLEVGNQVRGHKVKIQFHKPIYPNSLSKEEQKDLTEKVHKIVEDGLKKW